MNRRLLGMVGALALAGVVGVRVAAEKPKAPNAGVMSAAAAEKLKAAKAVVMGAAVAAEKPKAARAAAECCYGDSCCCGEACQEECCCGPACCGDGCCFCDSTTSKAAAVKVESCCEKGVKAVASCCPVTTAKAKAAVCR
jgi:hypothetical protein